MALEIGEWTKSSRSTASGNNCVEVRPYTNNRVAVRNSKMPDILVLFTPAEWKAFIEGAKAGEFDL